MITGGLATGPPASGGGGCGGGVDTLRPMPVRATKRGDERTPLEGRYDVLICGASFAGLAVARELAGSGAERPGRRPLRDRRAPDLGLRDPDRLDAGAGPDGRRVPALRLAAHPLPPRRPRATGCPGPSRPSTTGACASCSGRAATRPSRPRRSTAGPRRADGDGLIARRHRPRRALRAAGRRCARLAPHPGLRRRLPAAGRAALARASRSTRRAAARTSRSGSTGATCPPATAGPSPPRTSCGSGSAPSTPASTSRTHRPAHRGPRQGAERVPGQLDPPQAAPRHRGRRLLRRRLGRPLPAAERRGDPHRPLLRHRARPRAARRPRGRPHPRAGGRRATPSSTTPTSGSSAGCCGCRG